MENLKSICSPLHWQIEAYLPNLYNPVLDNLLGQVFNTVTKPWNAKFLGSNSAIDQISDKEFFYMNNKELPYNTFCGKEVKMENNISLRSEFVIPSDKLLNPSKTDHLDQIHFQKNIQTKEGTQNLYSIVCDEHNCHGKDINGDTYQSTFVNEKLTEVVCRKKLFGEDCQTYQADGQLQGLSEFDKVESRFSKSWDQYAVGALMGAISIYSAYQVTRKVLGQSQPSQTIDKRREFLKSTVFLVISIASASFWILLFY